MLPDTPPSGIERAQPPRTKRRRLPPWNTHTRARNGVLPCCCGTHERPVPAVPLRYPRTQVRPSSWRADPVDQEGGGAPHTRRLEGAVSMNGLARERLTTSRRSGALAVRTPASTASGKKPPCLPPTCPPCSQSGWHRAVWTCRSRAGPKARCPAPAALKAG